MREPDDYHDIDDMPDANGDQELHEEFPTHEQIASAQKITVQDVLDHITGPVISLIVHIILVALLGTIMVFKAPPPQKDISIEQIDVEIRELEKIPEPPEPLEEITEEIDVEIDRPDVDMDPVDVSVDDVAVDDVAIDVEMPSNLLSMKPNNSALKLPGVFASRSAGGRRSAMKKYGASTMTERTVIKGLNWLAKQQRVDGSWGSDPSKRAALTGLAVLAFLGHGETPSSATYGTTVLKGLRKLIDYSNSIRSNGVIRGGSREYGHAIVAYALSEGYALTKIPMVERAMNRMIATIVNGQNEYGAFNYEFNNELATINPKTGKAPDGCVPGEPRCDLSLGGWNFQALKAAFAAGSSVEGLETAIDNGIRAIREVHACGKGGFQYNRGHKSARGIPSMTAVGTLCLQLMGAGKTLEAKKGLELLENIGKENGTALSMDWRKKVFTWAVYTWYYQTQAIFQGYSGKGRVWRKWNSSFSKALMREQDKEGFWSTPYQKYFAKKELKVKGATPPHAEARHMFRRGVDLEIYSTALCSMMLEVYYRYLPTFKVVSSTIGDATDDDDDLDLIIE